jgi:hypothetical protein
MGWVFRPPRVNNIILIFIWFPSTYLIKVLNFVFLTGAVSSILNLLVLNQILHNNYSETINFKLTEILHH